MELDPHSEIGFIRSVQDVIFLFTLDDVNASASEHLRRSFPN